MFTLSGGHLFVLYDGAVQADLRLVDTRHEQTATFAAEGWAKVTRRLGCAALTAGPGITNGVSAMTAAGMNGSPMVVVGGRAPQQRWGNGSLQELDHVPIVASVVKRAATATSAASIVEELDAACRAAQTPHRGPAFVDIPLDVFGPGTSTSRNRRRLRSAARRPIPTAVQAVAKLVGESARPVLFAGGDVYWAHAEGALRRVRGGGPDPRVRQRNGTRHDPGRPRARVLARSRSVALKEADLVLVAGTPLDFRLGFGRFGDAQVVHLCDAATGVARTPTSRHRRRAICSPRSPSSPMPGARAAARTRTGSPSCVPTSRRSAPSRPRRWTTIARRSSRRASTESCVKRLDRDAIVIGDGGDFVSYAGSSIDSYEPGTFLDPGPYGCLGMGPGYALAAGLAHPDRQVVLMLGDGAAGFAFGDFEALVRHGVERRRGRRQQRHLGPREAPDAGVVRLRRRRRLAPGHPLRLGGDGARGPR